MHTMATKYLTLSEEEFYEAVKAFVLTEPATMLFGKDERLVGYLTPKEPHARLYTSKRVKNPPKNCRHISFFESMLLAHSFVNVVVHANELNAIEAIQLKKVLKRTESAIVVIIGDDAPVLSVSQSTNLQILHSFHIRDKTMLVGVSHNESR